MNKSLIEWCDFTWNPVTGCQHGCLYCYAAKQANRFSGNVLINKTSEQLRKEWDERGTRWVLEKPFKNEIGKVTPFPVKFEPAYAGTEKETGGYICGKHGRPIRGVGTG